MKKETLADFLAFASAFAVVYGVAQVAPALAWIVAGAFGGLASYFLAVAE